MKHTLSMPHLVLFGLLIQLIPALAQADNLQGPAFSDPGHQENMPAQWQAKGIDRGKWQPADGEPVDLAVTLDQHLYPALKPLIQEYARAHKLRIGIQEGTCGISAGKLMDKEADIGGFCCPPGETDRLPGLRYHTLGIAALALLVNPQNRTEDVSLAQARDMFQGRLRYWEQLQSPAMTNSQTPIRPTVRLHCKSRPGHWRLLLDNEDQFGPRVYEVSTIPDMINRVASQAEAIGYETLWMTERYKHKGTVKALRIDGVSPSDNIALAAGQYPLYRSYNISTWTDDRTRQPQAEALVDYLLNNFERVSPRYGIVPATVLARQGWQFSNTELVAEPTR